jgi:uridine kinase
LSSSAAEQIAEAIGERRARVVGIGGPPGAGKTTVARALVDRFPAALSFSLDDFCWSRAERERRGLPWRAMVGAHDLDALVELLDHLDEPTLTVPVYSAEIDDRVPPRAVSGSPSLVLIDGWLLGHSSDGYEQILERLDLFVFLDVPIDVTRDRRFGREAKLAGGFTAERMQAFWDEVLEPGIRTILPAAKARADLVVAE